MSNKINAKKLAEAITAVIVAALGDAAPANESEDAGDEEEAPKRGRGRPAGSTKKTDTKTATKGKGGKGKADPLEDEEEEEEEEESDDLGLDDEEEEVTQEDVVAAFKALKASHGIDKCKEVLAEMDESNVLNIAAKKYPEALKLIKRAASRKK